MRRRQFSIVVFLVFLAWNFLTYLFVTNRPTKSDDIPSNVVSLEDSRRRLMLLEARLRAQAQMHEKLLHELEQARLKLEQDILQGGTAVVPVAKQHPKVPPSSPPPVIDVYNVVLPILVIACNRVTVRRHLDQLLKLRPSITRFPIIVSQDCNHGPTADVIRSYGNQVQHIQQPDQRDFKLPWKDRKFQGYYKIARHYKWALQQVFHKFNHDAVIIVEDDLDISPDFFDFFAATFPVLHSDPSLWCVSAWNDNGKSTLISNEPELLHRTDFFPGLGWMLERKLFLELEPKWPDTFWDDWMRHPNQRQERSCIRPEISRTFTFGKIGVSKGQFFEKHLKFIKLNDKAVPFLKKNLSYLHKSVYDPVFTKEVYSAPVLTLGQVVSGAEPQHKAVCVRYTDRSSYKQFAKQLGLMDDLKSGVPRMGYRGVVTFMFRGRRTFLAPPPPWKGYDPKWN